MQGTPYKIRQSHDTAMKANNTYSQLKRPQAFRQTKVTTVKSILKSKSRLLPASKFDQLALLRRLSQHKKVVFNRYRQCLIYDPYSSG